MKLWIRFAFRNMTRNVRRTALTASTVLIATALVTLALSWSTGIFGTLISEFAVASGDIRLVDADFSKRESLQPLYENLTPVDPLIEAIRKVPGVVDVEPRIIVGVTLSIGEEIGDDFALVVGATDRYYRERLKGPDNLIAGKWLSGGEKEVVLGRKIAAQLGAKVGDKVLLLGQTQNGSMSPVNATLVGVVSGNSLVDQQAFLSLEEARWLTDMPDGALEILVYAASRDQALVGALADRLRGIEALKGIEVKAWFEREPLASSVKIVSGVGGFIQALIVFMAALAIFNTMTMSVLERTTEIGVMRAMGLTRAGAVGLFVLEAVAIGLTGGLVGTTAGAIPSMYLESHGVTLASELGDKYGGMPMKATMYADLTSDIMLQAVMIGLVIAVLGAFFPAIRAALIPPVAAMKARR